MDLFDNDFCYIRHMLDEHRATQRQLDDVSRILTQWITFRTGKTHAELLERLHALQFELVRRFCEETSGGCLEEAACRSPKLATTVSTLFADQEALLSELQIFIDVCQEPDPDAGEELPDRFFRFRNHLREHEHKEDQVLERAFNVCLD